MPTLNASLTLPHSASIATVGNELAIAPLVNALNDEFALVWRTTSLSNTFVVLDLGVEQSCDIVAALYSNLRSTDTIRVRCGTSAANTVSAPLYDGTFNAYSGVKNPDAGTKSVCLLPASYSARYWRLDITATGHPDGYVQVSRLVVGQQVDFGHGMDTNFTATFRDNSVITDGPGYTDVDPYPTYAGWKFSISDIKNTVWRNTIKPFLLRIGKSRCVLFVPLPGEPDTWQSDVIYGRMQKQTEAESRVYDGWWCDFEIMGISI